VQLSEEKPETDEGVVKDLGLSAQTPAQSLGEGEDKQMEAYLKANPDADRTDAYHAIMAKKEG
jgi:hypothetical protein